MVATLLLASCAPAETEEQEVVVTPQEEEVVLVEEEEAVAPEEEVVTEEVVAPEEEVVTEEEAVPTEEAVPAEEEVVAEEEAAPPEEQETVIEEGEEVVPEEEEAAAPVIPAETTWSPMSSNITEDLRDVWGSSPSNVFAVGGTTLHYDDSTWREMSGGGGYGVWGSSASNVFAVGFYGTILHYDGSTWGEMSSGTTEHLRGVWGISSSDVFVVGSKGTILHYLEAALATVEAPVAEEEEEVAEEEAYKLQLVSLEVESYGTSPEPRRGEAVTVKLSGYVKNISDESLSDVQVAVLFLDKDDKVIASTNFLIRENPLAPGQRSYFYVSKFVATRPHSMELYFRFLDGDIIPAEAVNRRLGGSE